MTMTSDCFFCRRMGRLFVVNFTIDEIPNSLVFGGDRNLFPIIGDNGESHVAISFQGVQSVGKDFLADLVTLKRDLAKYQKRLIPIDLSQEVKKIFHRYSLDQHLDIFDNLDQAVQVFLV